MLQSPQPLPVPKLPGCLKPREREPRGLAERAERTRGTRRRRGRAGAAGGGRPSPALAPLWLSVGWVGWGAAGARAGCFTLSWHAVPGRSGLRGTRGAPRFLPSPGSPRGPVPAPPGCSVAGAPMLEGRGGSFPSPKGTWRAKAAWGEDGCLLLPVPGGSWEGRVSAGSPGVGSRGRTVWEGRGNAMGNVRASGVWGSRRMGGKPLPLAAPVRAAPGWPCGAVSEKPGAGDGRLRSRELWSPARAGVPGREPHGEGMATGRVHPGTAPCTESLGRWLPRDGGRQGTGRGQLVSVTPSSLAGLGRRAWDSPAHPGAGAEEMPPAPGTGLLPSHPPPQLPRSFCRSQTKAAQAWGSHGCSQPAGPDGHRVPQGQESLG